jgi:hypothetical protein
MADSLLPEANKYLYKLYRFRWRGLVVAGFEVLRQFLQRYIAIVYLASPSVFGFHHHIIPPGQKDVTVP